MLLRTRHLSLREETTETGNRLLPSTIEPPPKRGRQVHWGRQQKGPRTRIAVLLIGDSLSHTFLSTSSPTSGDNVEDHARLQAVTCHRPSSGSSGDMIFNSLIVSCICRAWGAIDREAGFCPRFGRVGADGRSAPRAFGQAWGGRGWTSWAAGDFASVCPASVSPRFRHVAIGVAPLLSITGYHACRKTGRESSE